MSSSRPEDRASGGSPSWPPSKYRLQSFVTDPLPPPSGPDPEDRGWWGTLRTHPIDRSDTIVKEWKEAGLCDVVMGEVI